MKKIRYAVALPVAMLGFYLLILGAFINRGLEGVADAWNNLARGV